MAIKLTRRGFMMGVTAATAAVALPLKAVGGLIPGKKYTYIVFENVPLAEFGNRIPWVSAEITMSGPVKSFGFSSVEVLSEKARMGFKNVSGWVDEIYHLSKRDEITTIGFTYMGSAVTAIEGEAVVEKVWLDGIESKDYTVMYGDKDPMNSFNDRNPPLKESTVIYGDPG